MTETQSTPVGVTHVWPYGREVNPEAQAFSDEREADVWDELRSLTLDDEVRGKIAVALHETVNHNNAANTFNHELQKDDVGTNRVSFYRPREVELHIQRAAIPAHSFQRLRSVDEEFKLNANGEFEEVPDTSAPIEIPAKKARDEKEKRTIAFHLGSKLDAEFVIKQHRNHEICALVLWYPDESEHLKYLPLVRSKCPDLPIYVFQCDYRADKYGVEREGNPDKWESEFPSLAECEFEPPQVIVDDMLIKGNIHVVAGRFEAFKTMGLIELASAILDERPAFDYFKVQHRYPIMFLCADMSPELFDQYAAPFNLRKHGADFRVNNPKGNILHAVDSPVLQRAVNGRILILDTMLDFAKIKEAFQSGEWITFMQKLRELMTVYGCIAVVMTAHATKTGAKSNTIDPSEYLKDSVTFGGKIDVGFAFSKLENTSQIFIERIKSRGFKKPLSFTITVNDADGESNLDRGRFPVYLKPGEAGKKEDHAARRAGPKSDPLKQQKLDFLQTQTGSLQEKADAVNAKFNSEHPKETVRKWLKDIEFDS